MAPMLRLVLTALFLILLFPVALGLRMLLMNATIGAAGILDTAFGKNGIGFLIIAGFVATALFAFWPSNSRARKGPDHPR